MDYNIETLKEYLEHCNKKMTTRISIVAFPLVKILE